MSTGETLLQTLLTIVQVAQSRASFSQSEKFHHIEKELAKELHKVEMNASRTQHEKEMTQNRVFHQSELIKSNYMQMLDLEMQYRTHVQSYALDLISASRESERDMYEQISARMGYILVASSILFGALCTMLFSSSFTIPTAPNNDYFWYTAFILTSAAISFGCFLICIIKCLRVVFKLTKYMSIRSKQNFDSVYKYIDKNFNADNSDDSRRADVDIDVGVGIGGYTSIDRESSIDREEKNTGKVYNSSIFSDVGDHVDSLKHLETICDPKLVNDNENAILVESLQSALRADSNKLLGRQVKDITESMGTHSRKLHTLIIDKKNADNNFSSTRGNSASTSATDSDDNEHHHQSEINCLRKSIRWFREVVGRLKSNWLCSVFMWFIEPLDFTCFWTEYDYAKSSTNSYKSFDAFRDNVTKDDEKDTEKYLVGGTFSLIACLISWVLLFFPGMVEMNSNPYGFWPKWVFVAILGFFWLKIAREIYMDPDFVNTLAPKHVF